MEQKNFTYTHTNINTLLELVVQQVFAAGQETGRCDRCRIKAHSRFQQQT